VFFDGRNAQKPVYLVLEEAGRAELASLLGFHAEEVEGKCCRTVGNALYTLENPYKWVLSETRAWYSRGMKGPPPFTAVLFTLSHAAELMAADGEFAPNNYYERLRQVTGFPKDPLGKFASTTGQFWRMLAAWLAANDYELGRPTALATGSWKFVGLAMSQAIVRSADRQLFHGFFERNGFTPSDRPQVDEMHPYVDAWMDTSGPNARLKAAWKKPELRRHVCEIAVAELQDWSGTVSRTGPAGSAKSSTRLQMILSIVPGFPKKSIAIDIGRIAQDDGPPITMNDPQGREYCLANTRYGSFATVAPSPIYSPTEGLAGRVVLRSRSGFVQWTPRLVIPLVSSTLGPFWVEVNRTARNSAHCLLAKDVKNILGQVNRFLACASTGTAKIAKHGDLPGIPRGWVLYTDVVVTTTNVDISEDLAHLVPLDSGPTLQLAGGMRLGPGTWHADRPPTASLSSASGPAAIAASTLSQMNEEVFARVRNETGTCTLPSSRIANRPGETVTLAGYVGREEIDRQDLLLRSAAQPRPIHRQELGRLAYFSVGSATSDLVGQDSGKVSVRGMAVNRPATGETRAAAPPEGAHLVAPGGELDSERAVVGINPAFASSQDDSCVSRGHHHWKCETRPHIVKMSTPLGMTCLECGLSVLTRDRGKRAREGSLAPVVPATPARFDPEERGETRKPNADVLFDALCYLGSGTWANVEALIAEYPDLEPWEILEIGRSFAALGLLDVSFSPRSHRPRAWSVPAPGIYFIDDTTSFLSGFRSRPLVVEIYRRLQGSHGRLRELARTGAPVALEIRGIDATALRGVLGDVRDQLGRPIGIIEQAGLSLVAAAKELGPLTRGMTLISVGKDLFNLQHYDPLQARWRAVDQCVVPGAYRFDLFGRSYFFRDAKGETMQGAQQIVKVLAARHAGVRLHSYDRKTREFVSTLGAEPIGLLERALVACSGHLPRIDEGRSYYENVPANVAGLVLESLYK
jgi:hypothetical protein